MQLASRFGHVNQIRRDRPLTREELMQVVPSVFGEDKHTSRSENYTWIPTITVLESLQREGFQPFFACQTRVRDPGRRGYTKHMLRLRRDGEINGQHVPEIILLNSHDGTSSYQMLPGYFRFVCQNGCVCGQSLGEVRVPHRGNVVDRVIEGAYEVVGVFDRIEEKRDAMQSLVLPPPARQALAQAALTYRYGDEHQPVTTADILTPRRREDYGKDLWSAYQTIQENMLKGGISGRPGEISLCRLSIQAMASGHPSVTGTVTRTAVRNFSRISFIPDITGSSRSVMNVMLPAPDLYSLSFIHITRISYMKTLSQNTTSSACAPETGLQQLVATIVPDEQRISFWPQHFGLIPQWVTLEPRVFGWMDRLCENYCGGIWNLYTLNNGGAFMAPEPDDDDDETWVLFNAMNGNRAEMSPEAAGIAACLMTYSHHACRTECYAMTVHYYRLRDYALQHPECSAIMRIID